MRDACPLFSIIGEKSTMIVLLSIIAYFGSALAGDQCESNNYSLSLSINDFGFDLGRELIPGHGNFIISPFSIYAAMAMVYDGTEGSSSSQISKALRISELPNEDLKSSFRSILDMYLQRNEDYSLTVADGIFIQDKYHVKAKFVDDMEFYYRALVKTLDFKNNGDSAKEEINSWVDEITRGKIKDMFPQPIDPLTKLILINAIYFKGTWKTTFDKKSTYDGTFYKTNNEQKKVKLMQLKMKKFLFHDDASIGYKFLEMPYIGGDISMMLALPKDRNRFPDLEMTSEKLCGIRDSMHTIFVNRLVIPKFKFEYEKELLGGLEKLGIKDIFIAGAANLSGIVEESEDQKLYVSSVFHKALIDVNEEGSEVAAATKVTITSKSSIHSSPEIEFVADHPFLFFIIDKRNGIVIFSGRLDDP